MSVILQLKKANQIRNRYFRESTPDLVHSPEWIEMRELIFKALKPYPEAREALAAALMEAAKLKETEQQS